MEEETNVSNSSVRRCFLSYSIKPILGIYETITSWLSFVIVTDRSVGPAERTSKPVLRSWAGVRDSRKEVKILSRAADHHSRFGREPRERFLPFPFFSLLLFILPSVSTVFRARNTVDLHAISYRLSPIESAATSRRIDGRSLPLRRGR